MNQCLFLGKALLLRVSSDLDEMKKGMKPRMKHGVVINPALDKYDGVSAFPEKTAKAKQIIKDYGHLLSDLPMPKGHPLNP